MLLTRATYRIGKARITQIVERGSIAQPHGIARNLSNPSLPLKDREKKMVQFNDWCDSTDTPVGNHYLRVIRGRAADAATAIQLSAAAIPSHYAAEDRIAHALARLGKAGAAHLITGLLPQTPQIRSGDLGEIYATEWINAHSGYHSPVKRLRWKDHRNMAMRGDDVIGMHLDPVTQRLKFLKTEAKSRIDLRARTLTEARAGLDKDEGRPSPHALSFIAARLLDLANLPLVDAIDDALVRHGIPLENVRHLLFTFSGNAPGALLNQSLQAYPGTIEQWGVGLHVDGHAAFILAIYDRVIADAN